MKRGNKWNRWGVVTLIIVAVIVVFNISAFASIMYHQIEPTFDVGSQWVSDVPEINLVADEDGYLSGDMVVNGEKVQLEFFTSGGYAHLWIKHEDEIEEEFFLAGDYRISWNKKKIIINDIYYIADRRFKVDKIVLIRTDNETKG